jgi:hypothetical protein
LQKTVEKAAEAEDKKGQPLPDQEASLVAHMEALLTPPEVVSQLILGAPTYLLFEAGLFAARRFKRKTR